MRVWELLEKLQGVDSDALVVVEHSPILDAHDAQLHAAAMASFLVDPDGCDPDACCHRAEPSDRTYYGPTRVFVLEKGDPL